jgi:hypothetical protein
MAAVTVPPRRGAEKLSALLASPEVAALVADLESTRWTGRPGYPIGAMVGMVLVKSYYVLPTWTRTVALVTEHAALREAIGCPEATDVPSVYACYRFAAKLRGNGPMLDSCISAVLASLRSELPGFGDTIAIDGSDLPAYANGQKHVYNHGPERTRFSDPDASWGHRSSIGTRKGGGFYGFKLHAAVDVVTGLPLSWTTRTAKDAEVPVVADLLDMLAGNGIRPAVCIADKGYDGSVLRRLRASGHPTRRPTAGDAVREGGQGCPAQVRPRCVDLRRYRRQAGCGQVPLPDRRMQPGERLDQGRPPAHAHPPGDRPVEGLVPDPRGG